MPLAAVRERLDRALDLSTGRHGLEDERQRTLRTTIESSYHLLTADEQRLLRRGRPSSAASTWPTVEALAALEGDPLDLLHRLVDSSLLVADVESARYRLLFTVRAFLVDEIVRLGETGGVTRPVRRAVPRHRGGHRGADARPRRGRHRPAAARGGGQPASRPRPGATADARWRSRSR